MTALRLPPNDMSDEEKETLWYAKEFVREQFEKVSGDLRNYANGDVSLETAHALHEVADVFANRARAISGHLCKEADRLAVEQRRERGEYRAPFGKE